MNLPIKYLTRSKSRRISVQWQALRLRAIILTILLTGTVFALLYLFKGTAHGAEVAIAPTREVEYRVISIEEEAKKENTKWGEFVHAVDVIAPMYGYPKNVVLAQGALESSRGRSKFSNDRNNFLGIGAYDSDPEQAFHFENSEQCVIAYMQLIKKMFPDAWAERENPEALLKALKRNSRGVMYATDPKYVEKVMSMKEWNY